MERSRRPSRSVCIPGPAEAFRCRTERERRLALNPPTRPERGRGGRETFCRLVAAARTPAAQRVGRRLPAPHAGACRSARDCVPDRGHFSPTLRASPWCPIRPRVSRGDCSFSQLQLRVPTPFTPSLVSEWITDVSADLTNTAQKTTQPFRRSRAPTLLRLCARSACLLISPAHPEDL